MKLTEIQGLTKKEVVRKCDDFGIKNAGNSPIRADDFEINMHGQVMMDSNKSSIEIVKSVNEKLPLEFMGLSTMSYRTIRIQEWSYLGDPGQSAEWGFFNCVLPDFSNMPSFPSVLLEVSVEQYCQQSLIGLFENSDTAAFSFIPDDPDRHLHISKGHYSSGDEITILAGGPREVVQNTFELQDWLIDNGFEVWA